MALHVSAGVAMLKGSTMNPFSTSPDMQGVRFSKPSMSWSSRSMCSASSGRSDWRVFSSGRQCVERNEETASESIFRIADARASPKAGESEFVALQALGWRVSECGEQALAKRNELAFLQAREAFANGGDITEENMDRLVEALVQEKGQSAEDYRNRAVMFAKIAEFFSEGRAFSTQTEESWTSTTEIARAMQVIVDVVLAEDGRSATDYNCRAQLFAKSAEIFSFQNGG